MKEVRSIDKVDIEIRKLQRENNELQGLIRQQMFAIEKLKNKGRRVYRFPQKKSRYQRQGV